jgi:uncharacterized membrane protein
MSNSMSTLPSLLSTIQDKLTYIILPFYIILGISGNIFCVVYFLQKSQRSSSCALYLLLAAITNMFAVTFGVTTTILNSLKPLASALIIYCKLRMYINPTSILIARIFMVLASIDTYTMSSPKYAYRKFSKRTNAIKCAVAVVFCCPLIAVHIPIMNTIVAGQCVMTGIYSWIFAIYQTLIAGIFPPLFMIIFTCLAYFNIKNIGIQHDIPSRTKRQQQRQLVRMVAAQASVYVISAELNPITTLYKQLTANVLGKSADRKAIESFITFISMNFLLYLNTWAPFFIYCATSVNFRAAFIRLFKKNYRIQPQTDIIASIVTRHMNK